MSGGVFAVSRDIFEHRFFADEPFTEREAWIWLIGEAAWKNRRVRIGDYMISLTRGQCAFSVRFLADKWSWSKSRVGRFLDRLKTEAMIGTDAGQGVSVITICKYNEYQKVSLPTETQIGTPIGTDAGQMRDKEENRENIQSRKQEEEPLRGPAALPAKSLDAEVYRLARKVLTEKGMWVVKGLREACEFDDAYALELLRKAAEKDGPVAWLQAAIKGVKDRPYRNVIGVNSEPQIIDSKSDRAYREWEDRYYATVN